jgi:hypothetical protein
MVESVVLSKWPRSQEGAQRLHFKLMQKMVSGSVVVVHLTKLWQNKRRRFTYQKKKKPLESDFFF